MCYRDSFILFPQVTGIPVAWSVSYHHEEILKNANDIFGSDYIGKDHNGMAAFFRSSQNYQNYIQIECKDGEIEKWDWDNTPKTVVGNIDNISVEEYVIPHWLEDNLRTYGNKVESILKKLNPWRDRQDRLSQCTENRFNNLGYVSPQPQTFFDMNLPRALFMLGKDSPEVQEFEQIIKAYREIPGFVYKEQKI